MKIERVWAMPCGNTFSIPPISQLLTEEMTGNPWIDPFARNSKRADVCNDIDPTTNAEYHVDALDFLQQQSDDAFAGVLLDPPYSWHQIVEIYKKHGSENEGKRRILISACKDEAARITRPGGKVICMGFGSNGMGKTRGFELTRILLVCHGGEHNDTIVSVWQKQYRRDKLNPPWVFIDVLYLAHRARNSLKDLQFEDFPTGVMFGLLEQLRTIAFDPRIQSNKLFLFFDSHKSFRKLFFADYKRHRGENRTPEELEQIIVMHNQVDRMRRELFPQTGFLTCRQVGLESDDLIAHAALHAPGRPRRRNAVMITSDGDLYQCITDEVHWYDPQRGAYYTPRDFWVKKGIEPHLWGRVKTITGCHGDGVPGIPGIGEKTAISYVLGTLMPKTKKYQAIVNNNGQSIIKRNEKLVLLPHEKTKPIAFSSPCYDPKAFFEFCRAHGIRSYLQSPRERQWNLFFKGDFDPVKSAARRRR